MLSTLLNYRYYASDLSKTLDRVKATPTVEKASDYYEQNIAKVDTVDAFLSDYKLYTYALKAYGLEDQAASKGFIRKILESDLTDTASFANKLADERYRTFAKAFSFSAAGTKATASAQSTQQSESLIEAYSEYRVRLGTTLAAKTSYFETAMKSVGSVDDFLGNSGLFDVAMKSIGVDPALTSKAYVRQVFMGEISDDSASTSDDKFFVLAERFGFGADGLVPDGGTALDDTQTSKLIYDFNVATGNTASAQSAAHNTKYYETTIAGITSAGDLVDDPRLFDYIRTSFQLDSATLPAFLETILESQPDDSDSALAQLPTGTDAQKLTKERLTLLRDAFNFQADGTLADGVKAQDDTARVGAVDGYYANYRTAADKTDASKTSTYSFLMTNVKTVTNLLASSDTFGRDAINYVLRAFDLDPATESLTRIRKVLESDTSDPNSYVNKLNDVRYEKLAAAFNFGSDGKARAERVAQSTANLADVGTRYFASFDTPSTARKALIKTETAAYIDAVADVRTLDDLLANKTVTAFALKAFGLPADTSADTLRKAFKSDLGDASSAIYAMDKSTAFLSLVSSFNFGADGKISTESTGVQTPKARLSTENLYLLQTIESQAGDTSEGTRLALYFRRMAPTLTSSLKLLADTAVVQVVITALGLPSTFSQLDTDKQIAVLDKRLKTADFQDPKKLDKFISRFAALYDLANPDTTTSSVLSLFSGDSSLTSLAATL